MSILIDNLPRELDVYPTKIGTVTPRELHSWLRQVAGWVERQLRRPWRHITLDDTSRKLPELGEVEQFMSTPIYLLWESCESLHRARKCWDELNRTVEINTDDYEKQLLSVIDASKAIINMAFMTGTDLKARNAQIQQQQQQAYKASLRRVREIQRQNGVDVPYDAEIDEEPKDE